MSVPVLRAGRNYSQYRCIFVIHNQYQKGSAILREPIDAGAGNKLVGG